MRVHRTARQSVVVLACLIGTGDSTARADAAPTREGRSIIGLHVGIGDYTNGPTPLTLHRTVDANLLPVFRDRYGVAWVPSRLDVDRDGFRDGMLDLLERSIAARQAGNDVSAILLYTGHGSRALDQPGGDEPDGLDETFVTVHGSLQDASQDVRDDDIAAFQLALASHGISFLLIAESCHSGTTIRGSAGSAQVGLGVVRKSGGLFPAGPAERLFAGADFDPHYAALAEGRDDEPEEGLGYFVSMSASSDREVARTLSFGDDQWGVFSRALYEAIHQAPGPLSYEQMYQRVMGLATDIMNRHLKGARQTPLLHASGAGRDGSRMFLDGAPEPFTVRVIERSVESSTVRISAGVEAGFSAGSTVGFHRDGEALRGDSEPFAFGTVERSEMGSSVVGLQKSDDVVVGSVVELLSTPLPGFTVFLAPGLPESDREVFRKVAERLNSTIVDTAEDATLIVTSQDGHVDIFVGRHPGESAQAMDDEVIPLARPSFSGEPNEAAWAIEQLLQILRIGSLTHQSELMEIEWAVCRPADRDMGSMTSSMVINPGERYSVTIRNRSDQDLHLQVVEIIETDAGVISASVLSLGGGRMSVQLRADRSHKAEYQVQLEAGIGFERISQVWIASPNPIVGLDSLVRLTTTPEPSGRRGPGLPNPLEEMFGEYVRTRSSSRTTDDLWIAKRLFFTIARPD